ncbi:MAG: ECF transporter S component [Ruminococcaceae bacterium]|nr:ECF transporter S component [Oscillospiraceae bacterium]
MYSKQQYRTVLAALFLAVGLVLPLLTAQVKEIGDSLLPMHLPVMLCGLLCGAAYGTAVGAMLPFLRSVIFGMPPLYPNALWMALELATYGLVIGLVYAALGRRRLLHVYVSLLTAMLVGRLVWGASKALLLGLSDKGFTLQAFIAGGFVDALPGIVLQLILIPLLMTLLRKWRSTT